jgi:hypothetical protein
MEGVRDASSTFSIFWMPYWSQSSDSLFVSHPFAVTKETFHEALNFQYCSHINQFVVVELYYVTYFIKNSHVDRKKVV